MFNELQALEKTFQSSTLVQLNDAIFDTYQVDVWLKRDDLLHPIISGNKWRKLKYSLANALTLDKDTLVSMGGNYSNHLHALAYVGKVLGLKTIGYVRGEEPTVLTPTLHDAKLWGMTLKFVSRTEYRLLRQYQDVDSFPGLTRQQYWLPEGGSHPLALKGVAELLDEIHLTYDAICLPCGTGATLAGVVAAVPEQCSVLGIAALKRADFLVNDVARLLPRRHNNWVINQDYHFGGYAQSNASLTAFIEDFELKTNIPLDPVYTGKMLYALYDLIGKAYFKSGQRIIALHTGGLQGKRGTSHEKSFRT